MQINVLIILFFIVFIISLIIEVSVSDFQQNQLNFEAWKKATESYDMNSIQTKLFKEAKISGPDDPKFLSIMRASLDFVYHAETMFPDPGDPNKPLRLEDWQKRELEYAQWGEDFTDKGMAYRKPVAINSPRGFGKSVLSSIIAAEFALHFPYTKIAMFSTSQDQANELMAKVKHLIKNSIYAFMIDKKINSKTELGLSNGSNIKAFPQSEVTIRGYHPHIKIIDEKARIKRDILEAAIRPMGRKTCWLEIGISTPFGMNNNHYEDCMNTKVYHVRILKPTDVSWVDEEKLAQEMKMMGDRVAKQELFAEFLEDADTIFTSTMIGNMLNIKLDPQEFGKKEFGYILGTDFGKNHDYSAICILHKDERGQLIIDHLERMREKKYKVVINRIFDLTKKFNIKMIVPDGTGVGVSVMEELVDKVKVPIYRSKLKKKDKKTGKDIYRDGFIFTNASKLNIVEELEKEMVNSNIKCPDHFNTSDPANPRYIYKILENEMLGYTYQRSISGNLIFGHPELEEKHDDTLTAVMLAVWGVKFGYLQKPRIGGQYNMAGKSKYGDLKRKYMPTADFGNSR